MGHRMSSLPIARYCAQGPRLSGKVHTRAAVMSTAFHALQADDPDTAHKLALLDADELAEIKTWQRPDDIEVGECVLTYDDSNKECEVFLTADGSTPKAGLEGQAVTVGHFDMGWVHHDPGDPAYPARMARSVAFVGDIKRSAFTAADGVLSLQLQAYALAFAIDNACDHYCCGIWSAMDGTWQWGEIIPLASQQAADAMTAVLAAAQNEGDQYTIGNHCSGCYGRLQCPAYLLPPELAETSLAAFVDGGELDGAKAAELLLVLDRLEDTATRLRDNLKERVRAGLEVVSGGKRWGIISVAGRKSLDQAALAAKLGDLAPYQKTGKPSFQFRWVKQ
jgi:hypothetical protein